MKKAFLAMAILGATVASAADSYLYWMVGDGAPAYSYARVRDTSGDTAYLTLYDSGFESLGDSATLADITSAKEWGDSLLARLPTTDSSKSYVVELYNDSDKFVAQSAVISGAQIANYISSGGMSMPAAGAWSASSFAIPEPSSGLLMLVGCAVLGLRRRRQKNA